MSSGTAWASSWPSPLSIASTTRADLVVRSMRCAEARRFFRLHVSMSTEPSFLVAACRRRRPSSARPSCRRHPSPPPHLPRRKASVVRVAVCSVLSGGRRLALLVLLALLRLLLAALLLLRLLGGAAPCTAGRRGIAPERPARPSRRRRARAAAPCRSRSGVHEPVVRLLQRGVRLRRHHRGEQLLEHALLSLQLRLGLVPEPSSPSPPPRRWFRRRNRGTSPCSTPSSASRISGASAPARAAPPATFSTDARQARRNASACFLCAPRAPPRPSGWARAARRGWSSSARCIGRAARGRTSRA